jgi:hypothetical protein
VSAYTELNQGDNNDYDINIHYNSENDYAVNIKTITTFTDCNGNAKTATEHPEDSMLLPPHHPVSVGWATVHCDTGQPIVQSIRIIYVEKYIPQWWLDQRENGQGARRERAEQKEAPGHLPQTSDGTPNDIPASNLKKTWLGSSQFHAAEICSAKASLQRAEWPATINALERDFGLWKARNLSNTRGTTMKSAVAALLLLSMCDPIVLAQQGQAVLVVQSAPGGAQVYVDDELRGTTSPEGRLRISTLRPGKHLLRLSLSRYQDQEHSLTLVAGKPLVLKIAMAPQATAAPPVASQPSPPNQATAAQAAPASPSYEQARDWIVENINEFAEGRYRADPDNNNIQGHWRTWTYSAVSMNDCVLQFSVEFNDDYNDLLNHISPYTHSSTAVRIRLGEATNALVSPSAVAPAVSIYAPTNVIDVSTTTQSSDGVQQQFTTQSEESVNTYAVLFGKAGNDNTELVGRMAKALTYAIGLCRAQAPQTKEPF